MAANQGENSKKSICNDFYMGFVCRGLFVPDQKTLERQTGTIGGAERRWETTVGLKYFFTNTLQTKKALWFASKSLCTPNGFIVELFYKGLSLLNIMNNAAYYIDIQLHIVYHYIWT